MKPFVALVLALGLVTAAPAETPNPAADTLSNTTEKPWTPQPITPDVLRELVGVWYEDPYAFLEQVVAGSQLPKAQVQAELEPLKAKIRVELQAEPPRPWVTIYADLSFKYRPEAPPVPLRIKEFQVELPQAMDPSAHATIYRFQGRFYHASREYNFIPLTKRRPQ